MSFREHLPQRIRNVGGAARNRALSAAINRVFAWEGDGFATSHFCPFSVDREWLERYDAMRSNWIDVPLDVRWRMWILTQAARNAERLGASFAEFGTYRGGCAYMVLSATRSSRMWLYDTFEGVPNSGLAASEQYLTDVYLKTSVDHVTALLREWDERIKFIVGDVFDTVPANDPGALSLVHMDLNAAAATIHALEFAYARLVPGGIIVFDDYGQREFQRQRHAVDDFFAERLEAITALPTGQGLVTKLPPEKSH